jgi:hypothetical protein
MRRFFLALRVGSQDVARALPHEAEPRKASPDRIVRRRRFGVRSQLLPKQGDGPIRGRGAEVLGRASQQRPQEVFVIRGQDPRTPGADRVAQGGRIGLTGEVGCPVVDALPRHTEHRRDVGGGSTAVEFQHGQSPTIRMGVRCPLELTPKAEALPVFQFESAQIALSQTERLT